MPTITRRAPLVPVHAKLPADMAEALDRMAAEAGASRSDALRSAVAAFVGAAEVTP